MYESSFINPYYGETFAFADPFSDMSARHMPRNRIDALKWSERIALGDGVYRSAIERIAAYFTTDIEILGSSREQRIKYKEYLHDHIGLLPLLRAIAADFLVYGNSFTSVVDPFRRYLICGNKDCLAEAPLEYAYDNDKYNITWEDFTFKGICPKCGRGVTFTTRDRRSYVQDDITIKRWSPHEIEILWDAFSDTTAYIWRIPNYYSRHIKAGSRYQLLKAPKEIIEAVQDNKWFQFDKNVLFHAKELTLAGVVSMGFGISRVLSNFRQAWHLQVLRRYNEAIGLDYIMPLRLITPAPRQSASGELGDPILMSDLSTFSSRMEGIIREHRVDPASYHVFPYPIQYQMLGASSKDMTPTELIGFATDDLLNAIGAPVEFYKGTLTLQSTQPALRLMESQFSQLYYIMNRFSQWLVSRLVALMGWDDIKVELKRPSHADDISRQMARVQLMMSGAVSKSTGLASIGLNYEDEQKKLFDEEKFQAEEAQQTQEELELMGLGPQMVSMGAGAGLVGMPGGATPGGMPAGGMPAGGNAAGTDGAAGIPAGPPDPVQAILAQLETMDLRNTSLPNLDTAADTIAQQIFSLPLPERIRALRELKTKNEVVHAMVKSKLSAIETKAKQQGVQTARQSAQQGSTI